MRAEIEAGLMVSEARHNLPPHDLLPPQVWWAARHLDKAAVLLMQRAGLVQDDRDADVPVQRRAEPNTPAVWLPELAAQLGVDAQEHTLAYPDARRFFQHAAPALLPIAAASIAAPAESPDESPGYLALLHSNRRRATLMGSDGATHQLPIDDLLRALFGAEVDAAATRAETAVAAMQVPGGRQRAVSRALQAEYLQTAARPGVWNFSERLVARDWWSQLNRTGLTRLLTLYVVVRVLSYVFFFAALALLSTIAVTGLIDWALLWAGVLLWLLRLPLTLLMAWIERWVALKGGLYFKDQLLTGALHLPFDAVAQQGSGNSSRGFSDRRR
ncbi:MAG: hypothetical protein GYB67_10785 [Chloroflexi bacterium]|nr:hypothetical protein [Chloroflexota bacterium]